MHLVVSKNLRFSKVFSNATAKCVDWQVFANFYLFERKIAARTAVTSNKLKTVGVRMRQQTLFKLHLYEKILFQVKNSSMYSLYIKVWVLLCVVCTHVGQWWKTANITWVKKGIASMNYLPWSQILPLKNLLYSKLVPVRFHGSFV